MEGIPNTLSQVLYLDLNDTGLRERICMPQEVLKITISKAGG